MLSFLFSSLLLSLCFFGFCFHEKEQRLTIELQCFLFSSILCFFFFFFWFPVFVCLWIFVSFFLFFWGMLSFDYIGTAVYSIKYVFVFPCSFFGVSCLCASRPFFLFFDFFGLTLKKHHCSSFTTMQVANHQLLVKREVATYGFLITRVCNMWQVIFFFPFLRNFFGWCAPTKKHRKHLFPPPPTKKGFCLISQCLPLFLLVLLGFFFRILFRIPFLNFRFLNLMFLVSSFYPRLLLLPSIFACPLSPFLFLFSSLCIFLFLHVMLALLVPFYVCSDVFSCSCFYFPSSLVSHFLQLTSVFPLIGLVLPLFCFLAFLVLLCFLLFLLLFLLLFFCCCCFFFFLFFLVLSLLLLLLCFEEQTAMVAFYLAPLVCVRLFLFLGSSVETGHTTTKPQKLRTIFGHFCIQGIFSKKNLLPLVFGVLFRPSFFIKAPFSACFHNP